MITYPSVEDLLPVLGALAGNLVGTVHVDTGSAEDLELARQVVAVLEHVAGRVVCNGWPTGVAVVAAQHHGGPWPATTVPGLHLGGHGRDPPLAGSRRLPGLPAELLPARAYGWRPSLLAPRPTSRPCRRSRFSPRILRLAWSVSCG